MTAQAIERLEALARADPTVAPLAVVQAEAWRSVGDAAWAEAVPELDAGALDAGLPLLHAQTLRVDPQRACRLLARLAEVIEQAGHEGAGRLRVAIERGALDALAVLEASVCQEEGWIEAIAAGVTVAGARGAEASGADARVDPRLLLIVGHLAALPLLQACGRKGMSLLEGRGGSAPIWEAGYCPVCAAWPALAEMRGLERQRWLRCGRCGAGWAYAHLRCAFCGADDHRGLGYLATEAERDARQATTCKACNSYLKAVTTIGRMEPLEVAIQDLLTLELDVAAIEQEYGRPERPGFAVQVSVEPAPRRTRWLAWRR